MVEVVLVLGAVVVARGVTKWASMDRCGQRLLAGSKNKDMGGLASESAETKWPMRLQRWGWRVNGEHGGYEHDKESERERERERQENGNANRAGLWRGYLKDMHRARSNSFFFPFLRKIIVPSSVLPLDPL